MTSHGSKPHSGWSGQGRRILLWALVALAGSGALRQPLTAQGEARLSQAQLEHDARVGALQVQMDLWREALDRVTVAEAVQDEGRYEVAQQDHFHVSQELDRMLGRVDEARDSLELKRTVLLDALDERREQLRDRVEGATREGADQLLVLVRDLDNQVRALTPENGDGLAARPLVFWPTLDVDPRDTPEQLRFKAEIAERKVEQLDDEIGKVDEQIARIERLETLLRQTQDAAASRDRFDQTTLPLGTPRIGGGESVALPALSDTTGVALEDLPQAQRLEVLLSHKAQLERFRSEGRSRLRVFRAGTVGAAA